MDTSLQLRCTAVHRNEGNMHCRASNAGTFHSNARTFQIVHLFDTPMLIQMQIVFTTSGDSVLPNIICQTSSLRQSDNHHHLEA
jgi:hypothetical protein